MNYVELSKEVSYALRHAPWEYELEMDEEGFVPVSQLLSALNETGHYERAVTVDDLQQMMAINDKKRHEIVGDRIRALYGHSFPMHILKTEAVPPDILYHGTTHRAAEIILKEGLKPMSRQYVHMSVDVETAMSVGQRREINPTILVINAKTASHGGVKFYIGNEKVWLADNVPSEYISKKDN